MTIRIGILASGRGSNMQAIIEAVKRRQIKNAQVAIVISNKQNAPALEKAREYGVCSEYIDPLLHKGDRWRYDKQVIRCLKEQGVTPEEGLIVLAGYMRILSHEFIKMYYGRIMNVHPALLPAFPGLEALQQALEHGVKVSGCTVHFVDAGVDTGPIIIQSAVLVKEEDTLENLAERILIEEHRAYIEAIRLFTEERLKIDGRRVRIT